MHEWHSVRYDIIVSSADVYAVGIFLCLPAAVHSD